MPVYLRYGKIKGEVKDPAPYRGWIELLTFQWGVNRNISSPTGWSKEASASSEVVVTKLLDNSSQLLYGELLTGGVAVANVDFVKDGHVWLRYTMTGTQITSYQLSGRGDKPTESLSLTFQKAEYKQTPGGPPPPP